MLVQVIEDFVNFVGGFVDFLRCNTRIVSMTPSDGTFDASSRARGSSAAQAKRLQYVAGQYGASSRVFP